MSKKTILTRDVWNILGLPFDLFNMQATLAHVNSSIKNNEKCFISTPNLNFIIATQSDIDFYQSVVESDLSVADGMPMIWVARILDIPLPERIAGSTLFDELSKQTDNRENVKVFFFGGQKGVAEQAHLRINKESTAMVSCGFLDPGFVSVDEMSTSAIIEHLNKANPDFIVVALGAKKGQAWIQKNRQQLNSPVICHLGAVINFAAGSIERAPIFWQRIGFEWLWRIKQEPTLWRRYLYDGLAFIKLLAVNIFPLAVYDRVLKRMSCFKTPCLIHVGQQNNHVITLSGSVHYDGLDVVKEHLMMVLDKNEADIVIDCTSLEYIDGAFIATLLLFQSRLNEQGHSLSLHDVPNRIRRILFLNSVFHRFTIIFSQ
jgi:N-acetylglucosaminyldiphosphoundecaprenol N-acetyl-beta-D-mannosaminyltransferase